MKINLAKFILLLGAILVCLRLFFPPDLKKMGHGYLPDYPRAFTQSFGIGIVTGVSYFILRKKKDGKQGED